MAAFMPEPHILLIVVAPAASGSPAPIAACRAGAWPCPAGSTQPIRISSTLSAAIPARSTAAEIARAPSACAGASFKSPRKPPMGVRAAPTMTMGSGAVMEPTSAGVGAVCATGFRATPLPPYRGGAMRLGTPANPELACKGFWVIAAA